MTERWIILEASYGEVHFIEMNNWLQHNIICDEFEFDINREEYVDLMRFAVDRLQRPYGYKTILGIFLNKKDLYSSNGFICSQLVYAALPNLFHSEQINPNCVTPKDIHLLLIKTQ